MRTRIVGRELLLVIVAGVLMLAGCSGGGGDATADTSRPDGEQLYRQALVAAEAGQYEAAKEVLQGIPADAPASARAHNLLGLIHAHQGRPALARLEFEEAVRLEPALAEAQANLGVLALEAGDVDVAEQALRTAITANPYAIAARRGLAVIHVRAGRIEDARRELALVDDLSEERGMGSPIEPALRLEPADDAAALIAEHERAAEEEAAREARAAREAEAARRRAAAARPATRTVTRQLTLPAGTVFTIALAQPVSTTSARAGQEVLARVEAAVTGGGQQVIPSGASVRGIVTEVESSGRVRGRARLGLDFRAVETVAGWRDVEVSLAEGTLVAEGTKKQDAAKIGIGAVAGAVLGKVIGDNAAAGAVIGGAAGTAVVLATSGKEIELEAGTRLDLRLDAPVAVTVRSTEPVD
jgi:hypothetical protein